MDLFAHHIRTIDDVLEEDFCQHLIDKFDADENKTTEHLIRDEIKRETSELYISGREEWQEEDNILEESINGALERYFKFIKKSYEEFKPVPYLFDGENYQDTGYKIKKYEPGCVFDWHQDFAIHGKSARMLSIIWYLNTITEEGYTQFSNGLKIQPEVGKILIFPATWTYVHRGAPPTSENKYAITSFITRE